MKGKISCWFLAVSLMISQTAQAGQWTECNPDADARGLGGGCDTPTVGPAATRGMAELLDQPNGNVILTYYPQRARSGFGCGGNGFACGWEMKTTAVLTGYMNVYVLAYTEDGIRTAVGPNHFVLCVNGRGQGMKACDAQSENRADELGLDADFGLQQRLDSCTDVGCAGKTGFVKAPLKITNSFRTTPSVTVSQSRRTTSFPMKKSCGRSKADFA